MHTQALINVEETDIRVAVLEDSNLVELFVENFLSLSNVGNIYKGRVEGIVPGLKAVFVNVGREKNAFLHFSDVLEEYDLPMSGRPERRPRTAAAAADTVEEISRKEEQLFDDDDYIDPEDGEGDSEGDSDKRLPKRPARRSLKMSAGDEIMVQVVKDEINEKGPRITTFLSLPGRYLVMMPFSDNTGGISRRIEDVSERKRLRQLLRSLKKTYGAAFIIRTAGLDQDEDAIRKDAELLYQTWMTIQRRAAKQKAPACCHNDQEILTRVVRDNFTDDIDEILVDDKTAMRQLIESCTEMVPALAERTHYFDSPSNIFETFDVERQFQKALRRKVWLRSGGQIVIEETEALVAIDVNSGKYVGNDDQETMILKTNLEAARAISHQLRLRDLGGLIIIDFIDMRSRDNELAVLREFKRCLRRDRAKYSISDFSDYGLVEMTRKRIRMSLAKTMYRNCPYCDGSGRILNDSQLWKQMKYELIAELQGGAKAKAVELLVHSEFKTYLQKERLAALSGLAGKYGVALNVIGRDDFHHEQFKIVTSGNTVSNGDSSVPKGTSSGRSSGPEKKLESARMAPDNAS
jgi:Rne/Rng family ribonuclease